MDEWRPSLCLMATFGQKIPTPLINYPSLGFYNVSVRGRGSRRGARDLLNWAV